ncbi:hypothetical protein BaRGS_00025604 [Batillaria attramentaria]|uniref:THAP4-like heme-binding domain-containing protein n=1 Tax=Batillaria attramentaria TaxID=370345 RepID=A0ABD0K805_9CAEN
MHDMIKPLAWLLGRWRADRGGKAQYPTMTDMKYGEEVEFFHVGQPNIQFSCYSWNAENQKNLHRETGFIRVQPGTNRLAFISAHNVGVAEIQEGEFTKNQLKVETTGLTRLTFGKEPATKKLLRVISRKGDELEQVISMETTKTPMTEHLRITYKKV